MKVFIGTLLFLLSCVCISFGAFACIGMLLCWAFGIAFNVKVVFGIWLVYILLSAMVQRK